MKSLARSLTVALMGAITLGSAAAQVAYTAPQPFSRPGYTSTHLWDVNAAGTIVGNSDGQAFVYSGGVFSNLVHPDSGVTTVLTGIANDGTLVGTTSTSNGAGGLLERGFIHRQGAFTPFNVAGAANTTVRHVSSNGRYLTGMWTDSAGALFGFAYDLQTTTLTRFGSASEPSTIAQGANSRGEVTGSFFRLDPNGGQPLAGAFVHDLNTGTRTEYLEINGLQRPRFRDINDAGVITGFVGSQAFVGTPGQWHVFGAAPADALSMWAYGLNDGGLVVGQYNYPDGTVGAWTATPVPEPQAWALLLLGLGAVLVRARRAV
jgi:hypothetical protein